MNVDDNRPDQHGNLGLPEANSPARQCGACGGLIETSYFEIDGEVRCAPCKEAAVAATVGGSRLGRLVKATALGVGGGAIGAGIYYAILAVTGYQLGLIAIAVGLLVGGAVRRGSAARGGWFYQLLAMSITYVAIVVTYMPMILAEVRAGAFEDNPTQPVAPAAPLAAADPATDPAVARTDDVADTPPDVATDTAVEPSEVATLESSPLTADDPSGELPAGPDANAEVDNFSFRALLEGDSPVGRAFVYVFVFFIAFAAPFLAGLENFMGLLIIAFALYEAWKLNKRRPLAITGPHTLAAAVLRSASPTPRHNPPA